MALNHYFNQRSTAEANLYEDIIIESLKIYGQDVYYLPRETVNEDRILGEDVPSLFSSAHKIEMYIENTEGFDGEGDLFTKFGVEIRDAATFIVSRRRWTNAVGQVNNSIESIRPREGDLIYLTLSKSLFEIMHVEHEQPFYQISNLPTFKLRCELFVYNDERLNTNIEEIDEIEKDGYTVNLNLSPGYDSLLSPYGFDFKPGDFVQQINGTQTVKAEVLSYNTDTNIVTVSHISTSDGKYGNFKAGTLINYRDSSVMGDMPYWDSARAILFGETPKLATRTILSIGENVQADNSFAINDEFDTTLDALDFLDFSENNPFGDPEDL